ncbi:hypothetical protein MML61_19635 [Mycobacterium marinum]|nr:hypothetical protein [Mycobacterium marinum]WCS17056.1 hypothetical protein MML61_19635 [Mycobacterium marinum]
MKTMTSRMGGGTPLNAMDDTIRVGRAPGPSRSGADATIPVSAAPAGHVR